MLNVEYFGKNNTAILIIILLTKLDLCSLSVFWQMNYTQVQGGGGRVRERSHFISFHDVDVQE